MLTRILFLVSLLLAGCASQPDASSGGYVVIPGSPKLGQTDWVPTPAEIQAIESSLGFLFLNPDERIAGLQGGIAPYPLRDYVIRYSITGPKDSTFVVGEAVHKSRPEASTQLDANQPGYDPKRVKGPFYFTFVYDKKLEVIRSVLFSSP